MYGAYRDMRKKQLTTRLPTDPYSARSCRVCGLPVTRDFGEHPLDHPLDVPLHARCRDSLTPDLGAEQELPF